MGDNRCFDALIIGGAAAGGMTVRGMAHELGGQGKSDGCRIGIVEPRGRVGLGPAWDEAHPMMLSNMHAHTLRYYGGYDARRGLEIGKLRDLIPASGEPGAVAQPYVSRQHVGELLAVLHQETKAIAARQRIFLEHLPTRALRVERLVDRYRVTLESGETVEAAAVVLALGMLPIERFPHLADQPGYCGDGWNPHGTLADVKRTDSVAIIGSGPTAIDIFLRLEDRNLIDPVTMISRTCQLPAVRPVLDPAERESNFTVRRLWRLFERGPFDPRLIDVIILGVLSEAGATPRDLALLEGLGNAGGTTLLEATLDMCETPQSAFAGLKLLDDLAPIIWRCASEEGRAHIMARWAKQHANFSFAIPPHNGRAVMAAHRDGRLVTRDRLLGVALADDRFRVEIGEVGKIEEVLIVDRVFNATGFEGPLDQVGNPLIHAMVADGLLVEADYRGAKMDYETGQVRDEAGERIPGLFIAGGSLTRSAGYMVNAFSETTRHALAVGIAVARHLQRPQPQGVPAPVDARA